MNQQYPNGVQQNQASAYHQTTPGTTRNGYAPAVQQPIPYTVQTQTQTQPQKSAGSKDPEYLAKVAQVFYSK